MGSLLSKSLLVRTDFTPVGQNDTFDPSLTRHAPPPNTCLSVKRREIETQECYALIVSSTSKGSLGQGIIKETVLRA